MRLYQIWTSRGRGLEPGPRFLLLRDAIAHATKHAGEGAHGIRRPTGEWYRWPDTGGFLHWAREASPET